MLVLPLQPDCGVFEVEMIFSLSQDGQNRLVKYLLIDDSFKIRL